MLTWEIFYIVRYILNVLSKTPFPSSIRSYHLCAWTWPITQRYELDLLSGALWVNVGWWRGATYSPKKHKKKTEEGICSSLILVLGNNSVELLPCAQPYNMGWSGMGSFWENLEHHLLLFLGVHVSLPPPFSHSPIMHGLVKFCPECRVILLDKIELRRKHIKISMLQYTM